MSKTKKIEMEGHRGTIWNHTDNMEYLKEEESLIDNFFITDGLQSNYPHHRTLTYSFDSSTLYDAVYDWFSDKAAALVKYGPMNSWDVSLVGTMQSLFLCYGHDPSFGSIYANCQAFNENISSWNVSRVTNMVNMFNDASSFNQSLSSWNVARVTNMSGMFNSANKFNQSLSSWNVARVTDMYMMFFSASSFNQSLSEWNVASVTNMYSMFAYASSFNQKLCWNVAGKQTTDMFVGTKGGSVDCAPPTAKPSMKPTKPTIKPSMQPTNLPKPSASSTSSVVVGVSVPIVIIAVGILIFVIMRKRRKASHKPDSSAPPSNKDTFEDNTDSKADDKVEESSGDKPSSTPMESDDSFKWKRVEIKTPYLNRK